MSKNIDLVTLPSRDSVQLTIYNSEDLTMVKETRYITVKKGANPLQFAWAGTLIDPTSIELRPLDHADELEVVDAVFPGQKPQHLIWNLESKFEGQVKVEVSYFTSGLTWAMDYVGIAEPKEEKMAFTGYVRVSNDSGEEYENAEVRLIVGTINLVEKIAELAARWGVPEPMPASPPFEDMKKQAMEEAFDEAEGAMMSKAMMAPAPGAAAPKQIVKEGLSEYFMFSIDGTETIKEGWSKRMRAVKAEGVKFDVVYRLREAQYGPRPVKFFIWKNDQEHRLGESPLPDGRIRVFRDNGKEGLGFLGEQTITYVPVQADLEVNLGPDDNVVHKAKRMGTTRMNFSYDDNNDVNGWDETQKWTDEISNFRDQPIVFELRRVIAGDVEYESKKETKLFDYQTVDVVFKIDNRDREEYAYTLIHHLGENQKKDRIIIK